MGRMKFMPKYIAEGALLQFIADALLLLIGSMLIERGILSVDCFTIWSLIALVVSSAIGSGFSAKRSAAPMNGYILAGVCLIMQLLLYVVMFDTPIRVAAMVKNVTALFCGALIGNFVGMTKGRGPRKKGNKRRMYA